MKISCLKKYAALIACAGAHVQSGDEVVITAELDQPQFVEYVAEACYRLGAKKVTVEFAHQPLQKLHVRYRSVETLSSVEDWEIAKLEHYIQILPVRIYLVSEDPDGLCGMDREKYAKGAQGRYKVLKPLHDRMDNRYKWCIAAVPGRKWAKKVFPGLRAGDGGGKIVGSHSACVSCRWSRSCRRLGGARSRACASVRVFEFT